MQISYYSNFDTISIQGTSCAVQDHLSFVARTNSRNPPEVSKKWSANKRLLSVHASLLMSSLEELEYKDITKLLSYFVSRLHFEQSNLFCSGNVLESFNPTNQEIRQITCPRASTKVINFVHYLREDYLRSRSKKKKYYNRTVFL